VVASSLACLSLLCVLVAPAPVSACGGCVVPPTPPGFDPATGSVLQSAERVFFHQDPLSGRTTAWVEVRYTGLAQDFGWIVPLPVKPKISVGTNYLFDRLDQATAPRFHTYLTPFTESCHEDMGGPGGGGGCGFGFGIGAPPDAAAGGWDWSGATGTSTFDRKPVAGVDLLERARVGPYNYAILKSGSADSLAKWLDLNGYVMPASGKPVIAAHVAKGDLFVAFRLHDEAGVNEIRPVVFEMHDADPCVPLRLTAIAAVEDLPVVVYMAGNGRAVPKNHLNVVVNPMRLDWDGGVSNYPQVMAEAIDEAAGHAFVTEFAGPVSSVRVTMPASQSDGPTTVRFNKSMVFATSHHLQRRRLGGRGALRQSQGEVVSHVSAVA